MFTKSLEPKNAQSIFLELITDTAGRVGGKRLPCPICGENYPLTMVHLLLKCKATLEGRENAAWYMETDEHMEIKNLQTNDKLLCNLIMETHEVIRGIISTARVIHYRQND